MKIYYLFINVNTTTRRRRRRATLSIIEICSSLHTRYIYYTYMSTIQCTANVCDMLLPFFFFFRRPKICARAPVWRTQRTKLACALASKMERSHGICHFMCARLIRCVYMCVYSSSFTSSARNFSCSKKKKPTHTAKSSFEPRTRKKNAKDVQKDFLMKWRAQPKKKKKTQHLY